MTSMVSSDRGRKIPNSTPSSRNRTGWTKRSGSDRAIRMRIALDTNRYVDLARGMPEAAARAERADVILLPFIVLGELRAGFVGGRRREHNERKLIEFLNAPRVEVLFPDDSTTHHYARLFLQLRKQGT